METAHACAVVGSLALLPLLRRLPPFLSLLLAALCVVGVLTLVVRGFARGPVARGVAIGTLTVGLVWLVWLTYA